MKMTQEMLLSAQKEAEKKIKELKAQAMIEITFELEDKIERAYLNLDSIKYSLEAISHFGTNEVFCFILPIS